MTYCEKIILYQKKPSLFLYQENILPDIKYQELLQFLEHQNYKAGMCLSGKPIPRLQIWYHLQGSFFCDAWKYRYDRWKAESYQPILLEVQKIIEEKTHKMLDSILEKYKLASDTYQIQYPEFNSCLVNKYRNGQDSIKPHQDSHISFGDYPTISNLSLKSSRNMVIKPLAKLDKKKLVSFEEKEISFHLSPNSLFIMAGSSQKYFTHSIPKEDTEFSRYSLTFRQHFQYEN